LPDKAQKYEVIIVGAGAAGLMCALTAAGRGKRVAVLERSKKPGAKILISGGGRCNFTNQDTVPTAYLSSNPHFAKSALSRYTPWDIMSLLAAHDITWHEKTLGQLFCDQGAKAVLNALLAECETTGVELHTGVDIQETTKEEGGFQLVTNGGGYECDQLVMASGGISIPKMGATDFAYQVARQFGCNVVEPVPALVPLIFEEQLVNEMKQLAGVSADSIVSTGVMNFRENLLFTHRGLSGPAILQISSYWQRGEAIFIDLLPNIADKFTWLKDQRSSRAKASLKAVLAEPFSERLAEWLAEPWPGNMADLSNAALTEIAERLGAWKLIPTGTEGFKKAEVTKGGVNTDYLSSKTMECKNQPGLYFIGECVDVTGWLGGYNFQWAWASGHACGQAL
jgi:predicted Rossmann fold flavoprotein